MSAPWSLDCPREHCRFKTMLWTGRVWGVEVGVAHWHAAGNIPSLGAPSRQAQDNRLAGAETGYDCIGKSHQIIIARITSLIDYECAYHTCWNICYMNTATRTTGCATGDLHTLVKATLTVRKWQRDDERTGCIVMSAHRRVTRASATTTTTTRPRHHDPRTQPHHDTTTTTTTATTTMRTARRLDQERDVGDLSWEHGP